MERKRVLRIAVATAMVVGGLVFRLPSAQATSAGSVSVVGAVGLACPGLGYPVVGGLAPVTCPFVFASATCVDGAAHVLKAAKPIVAAGAGCVLGAGGAVTGWCGLNFGTGVGGFVDSTGAAVAMTFVFIGIGQHLVITGDVAKPPQAGLFHAAGEALPPTAVLTPAGGSCTLGTAVAFPFAVTATFELI